MFSFLKKIFGGETEAAKRRKLYDEQLPPESMRIPRVKVISSVPELHPNVRRVVDKRYGCLLEWELTEEQRKMPLPTKGSGVSTTLGKRSFAIFALLGTIVSFIAFCVHMTFSVFIIFLIFLMLLLSVLNILLNFGLGLSMKFFKRSKYHKIVLDDFGRRTVELINGQNKVKEIAEKLRTGTSYTQDQMEDAVLAFIGQLVRRNVVSLVMDKK